MSNYLSFCLILLFVASTLLIIGPINAQPSANHKVELREINITDKTVTLSWTYSAFTSNSFTSYILCVFTPSGYDKPLPSWSEIWSTTDRNQTTTIVSNLQPSSRYYFQILDSGIGSNILEVHTLPSPTSIPTPLVPEFPLTISLVTVLAVVSLLLIISKRKLSFNY